MVEAGRPGRVGRMFGWFHRRAHEAGNDWQAERRHDGCTQCRLDSAGHAQSLGQTHHMSSEPGGITVGASESLLLIRQPPVIRQRCCSGGDILRRPQHLLYGNGCFWRLGERRPGRRPRSSALAVTLKMAAVAAGVRGAVISAGDGGASSDFSVVVAVLAVDLDLDFKSISSFHSIVRIVQNR